LFVALCFVCHHHSRCSELFEPAQKTLTLLIAVHVVPSRADDEAIKTIWQLRGFHSPDDCCDLMPASPELIDQQLVVGSKRRLGRYEARLGSSGKVIGQLFSAAGDDTDALGFRVGHLVPSSN